MNLETVSSNGAPTGSGGYSQAIRLTDFLELLFISGRLSQTAAGKVPDRFEDQCCLVWRNIEAQLGAAGMSFDNLVKVTTFLSDREVARLNRTLRQDLLGPRTPALTVVIVGIFDAKACGNRSNRSSLSLRVAAGES